MKTLQLIDSNELRQIDGGVYDPNGCTPTLLPFPTSTTGDFNPFGG